MGPRETRLLGDRGRLGRLPRDACCSASIRGVVGEEGPSGVDEGFAGMPAWAIVGTRCSLWGADCKMAVIRPMARFAADRGGAVFIFYMAASDVPADAVDTGPQPQGGVGFFGVFWLPSGGP